jgi:hypothetical protein
MKLKKFERLLDLRGPDLRRWSDRDREAAQALLASSESAWRVYQQALQLDRALLAQPLGLDEEESVRRLRASIRARVAKLPSPERFRFEWLSTRWAQVGVFAAIAAVAISIGWSVSDAGENPGGREDFASLLMRDSLEDAP